MDEIMVALFLFAALIISIYPPNHKECIIAEYRPRTQNEIIQCQSSCGYKCKSCFDPIAICE